MEASLGSIQVPIKDSEFCAEIRIVDVGSDFILEINPEVKGKDIKLSLKDSEDIGRLIDLLEDVINYVEY